MIHETELGTRSFKNGACRFRVWAPSIDKIEVYLVSPERQIVPLEKDTGGYHSVVLDSIQSGSRYYYRLNRTLLPGINLKGSTGRLR